MLITFEELRKIKRSLPTGSVNRIAEELKMEEQTVRNFFGAKKASGKLTGWHRQSGPIGGVLKIEDTSFLDLAQQILQQQKS